MTSMTPRMAQEPIQPTKRDEGGVEPLRAEHPWTRGGAVGRFSAGAKVVRAISCKG